MAYQGIKTFTVNDNAAKIIIEGDITLLNGEDIKNQVVEVLDKYHEIEIMIKNVENIDMFGIQLVYSIRKFALETGKMIKFDIKLTDAQQTLVNSAGFGDLVNINEFTF